MGQGQSSWSTLFNWFTYTTVALDLTDAVFDYAYVAKLAKHPDTVKHAKWLGVCTSIALLLEVVVKTAWRGRKDKDTAEGLGYPSYDTNDKDGLFQYIVLCAWIELSIFCIEDATTLFIWWQTGTYDTNDALAQANLITTVMSAVVACIAFVYANIHLQLSEKTKAEAKELNVTLVIVTMLFVAFLVFWAVFALGTIQAGDNYGCLATCNSSGAGSDDDTIEEGDVGLNKAVKNVYIVGMIVASMSALGFCVVFVSDSDID